MTIAPWKRRIVDAVDGFMNVLPENIAGQLQFQCLQGKRSGVFRVQADLSIKRKGAFPDGGHHIVIGMNGDSKLFSENKDFWKIMRVLFSDATADFDINVSFAEQTDGADGLIKALGVMAETVIGSGIGTVERDVNAARPVLSKKSAQDSPSRVPLVLMVRIMPMFRSSRYSVLKSGKRSGSPPVRRRKSVPAFCICCASRIHSSTVRSCP